MNRINICNELIIKNSFFINFLDSLTFQHSFNVCKIVSCLTDDEEIVEGALLHDIGKVFILKKIIYKKNLNKKNCDFSFIKLHTLYGYEFYKKFSENYNENIAKIILYHHEKEDGSGYPIGLKNDSFYINKVKLITLVDIFDALYNIRNYRKIKSYSNDMIKKILYKNFNDKKFIDNYFEKIISIIS